MGKENTLLLFVCYDKRKLINIISYKLQNANYAKSTCVIFIFKKDNLYQSAFLTKTHKLHVHVVLYKYGMPICNTCI